MKRNKALLTLFLTLFLSLLSLQARAVEKPAYDATYGAGEAEITVATGSPGALGLLEALAGPVCRANRCRVNWVKKGSGESLGALRAGEVDLVMVHAPAAEKAAVKEGWAVMRTLLGSNEFYIVGPASDPAGIRSAQSAKEAFARIAAARARFFSRGDDSGTHKREMKIWQLAGLRPDGPCYVVTHDFMGPTLMRADRESGYFMTESSTFFAKRSRIQNLDILFRGDPILVNVYHALKANPEIYPRAHHDLAAAFVSFVGSPEGQKIFREYGQEQYGTPLYNDAEYARKWEQ